MSPVESNTSSEEKPRPRITWKVVIALAVSAAIIAWLVHRAELAQLSGIVAHARPGWLVVAAINIALLPVLMAWRWRAVLVAQGAGSLPLSGLIQAVMTANLLNTVLPGKAGDLAKAWYVRSQGGLVRGVGGVILERAVDVAVLGLLGLLGYGITSWTWGLWAAVILGGGATAGVAGLRWLPVERWLPGKKLPALAADFRFTAKTWAQQPRLILQTVGGSLAVWTLCAAVLVCLAHALRLELTWPQACAIIPLSVMAGMVPLTLGGLGPREAVMTALLTTALGQEGATALSLGYTIFTYWLLALFSLPFAWPWLSATARNPTSTSPSRT